MIQGQLAESQNYDSPVFTGYAHDHPCHHNWLSYWLQPDCDSTRSHTHIRWGCGRIPGNTTPPPPDSCEATGPTLSNPLEKLATVSIGDEDHFKLLTGARGGVAAACLAGWSAVHISSRLALPSSNKSVIWLKIEPIKASEAVMQ